MRNLIKNLSQNSIIRYLLIHTVKLWYNIYRYHIIPENILLEQTFQK
jgi:hypothetical protein